MARLETNIQRVRKSVQDTQGRYVQRTRATARKLGAATRSNVRANIAPPVFPGYAISGALAKKVVASEPIKVGNGWIVRVHVQLTGRQARYAKIHETGGRIKVKNPAQLRAMFANLRRHGQLGRGSGSGRKLAYIRIRRKGYFARGVEKTRREWNIERLRREIGKV